MIYGLEVKDRNCIQCGKPLFFEHYFRQNRETLIDTQMLIDIWNDNVEIKGIKVKFQIKCCDCCNPKDYYGDYDEDYYDEDIDWGDDDY